MCSGSSAFVKRHGGQMDDYVAVINFDGLSSVLCPRNVIQATPEVVDFVRAAAVKQKWSVHGTPALQPNSDHAAFVEAGVPAIWAHEGPRSPYQHTEADVFEHLDMQKLLHTASVGARCAIELACDSSITLARPAIVPWKQKAVA